jgi:hypothetical protein
VNAEKLKELKKITKFCRENGINQLELDGFKLSFSPAALFPEKPQKETEESSELKEEMLSPEAILLWSANQMQPDPSEVI